MFAKGPILPLPLKGEGVFTIRVRQAGRTD